MASSGDIELEQSLITIAEWNRADQRQLECVFSELCGVISKLYPFAKLLVRGSARTGTALARRRKERTPDELDIDVDLCLEAGDVEGCDWCSFDNWWFDQYTHFVNVVAEAVCDFAGESFKEAVAQVHPAQPSQTSQDSKRSKSRPRHTRSFKLVHKTTNIFVDIFPKVAFKSLDGFHDIKLSSYSGKKRSDPKATDSERVRISEWFPLNAFNGIPRHVKLSNLDAAIILFKVWKRAKQVDCMKSYLLLVLAHATYQDGPNKYEMDCTTVHNALLSLFVRALAFRTRRLILKLTRPHQLDDAALAMFGEGGQTHGLPEPKNWNGFYPVRDKPQENLYKINEDSDQKSYFALNDDLPGLDFFQQISIPET